MANVSNGPQTMAIDVCFSLNFAVVFDFNLFPVPPIKTKSLAMSSQIGKTRQLGTCFFLFYNALCLLTHQIILRY
jgi:hypothetical protein